MIILAIEILTTIKDGQGFTKKLTTEMELTDMHRYLYTIGDIM